MPHTRFEIRKSRQRLFHWVEIGENDVVKAVGEGRFATVQAAREDAVEHGAPWTVGYIGRKGDEVYD